MTDTENKALYIAEQCRKSGLTLAGAAGVIANVEAESAFKSTNLQDCYNSSLGMSDETYTARVDNGTYRNFTGDAAGYGLAQWTAGDRKKLMLDYHRKRNASIGDFRTQVDFLIDEMRGYSRAWNTVTNSNDAFECGYAVCRYYEIPADTENQANYRGNQAQKWQAWLVANANAESTITDEPQQQQKPPDAAQTDDDGNPIPVMWPPRMLQVGKCTGWPEVKLLQSALCCHGYNVLVDGIFGAELANKLTAYQTTHGLAVDAICGPKTWASVLKL